MSDLITRFERLEAVTAIHTLKARYTAFADAKYTPERTRQAEALLAEAAIGQAGCFTEDAVWEAGDRFGGGITGRAALAEWFARPPWRFALHLYSGAEIDVTEDTAHGRWRLWQVAVADDGSAPVLLVAITHEHYARGCDGAWLISRMKFEQLHIVPLSDGALPIVSA